MRVWKILRAPEWAELEARGETAGSADDRRDGFVHLSTAGQLRETARRHFAGEAGLVLVALEADRLGAALRWAPARGGALFPHLHAPLRRADLVSVEPLPPGPDGHAFPDGIP